jgi:hypothetical protein
MTVEALKASVLTHWSKDAKISDVATELVMTMKLDRKVAATTVATSKLALSISHKVR